MTSILEESPAATSNDTRAAWHQRIIDLDLDPARDAINIPIMKHTRSLEELKRWYAMPANAEAPINNVKPEKIATIPYGLVRRYVTEHVYNQRVIVNPATIRAIEERVGRFFVLVQVAADITITAAQPLIINNTGVLTVYDNVTIQDGGFIRITAPATFTCNNLTKIQSGGDTSFDVSILGINGTPATAGTSPAAPGPGASGGDAHCDCCHGSVSSGSSPGQPGATGAAGGDAMQDATPGGNGPIVNFSVTSTLTGTLSFLNQGGTGGAGGAGGNGAQGGQGGTGGNGTTCGAFHPGGSDGGAGGQGGNGGNGSNGADGGNGGTLTITVPGAAVKSILVTNGVAPGGVAGLGGAPGLGGAGGLGGDDGGTPGNPGALGTAKGLNGQAGQPGGIGTATLNGTPIG